MEQSFKKLPVFEFIFYLLAVYRRTILCISISSKKIQQTASAIEIYDN